MINDNLFTSNSEEWSTPQWLFDELNHEFHFDLDACASAVNHKCDCYYTKEQNGLDQQWHGVVWCNPPYGKEISKWVKKAYEYFIGGGTVVMLLPARTDTKWWHAYVRNAQLRFIKGRLKFNESKQPAPFPSVVAIYDNRDERWY